jgi:predicted CoA-binding protein
MAVLHRWPRTLTNEIDADVDVVMTRTRRDRDGLDSKGVCDENNPRRTPAPRSIFIAQPAMAVVGVSRSGRRFGNTACRELRAHGYRIYPIHPVAHVIDGMRCYQGFEDLPERIDAVLVVVPPTQAVGVVREAAAAGIHDVWLQQGEESPAVLQTCDELGVTCISGECILMRAVQLPQAASLALAAAREAGRLRAPVSWHRENLPGRRPMRLVVTRDS